MVDMDDFLDKVHKVRVSSKIEHDKAVGLVRFIMFKCWIHFDILWIYMMGLLRDIHAVKLIGCRKGGVL